MNEEPEYKPHPLGYVPLPVWAFLIGALYVAGSKIYESLLKWNVLQLLAPFLLAGMILIVTGLIRRKIRERYPIEVVAQEIETERTSPIIHETIVNIMPRHWNTQQETDLFEVIYNPETERFKIKSVKQENQLGSLEWPEVNGRAKEKRLVLNRSEKTTLEVSMNPFQAAEIFRRIQAERIQDIRAIMSMAGSSPSPTPLFIQTDEKQALLGG